jgi:hypothetical protein
MRKHRYHLEAKCVFCRVDLSGFPPEQRTTEHIIPRALNGTLEIVDGVCDACAKISNKLYEHDALNNDLLLPRRLLALKPPRKRGKNQKPRLPLPPVDLGSGSYDTYLSDGDHPGLFSLVGFPPPGRLAKVDRGGELSSLFLNVFSIVDGRPKYETSRQSNDFKNGPFALTLAKIAYCYAMAELGDLAFDGEDIRDLLLGKRGDVYNFVGSTREIATLPSFELHELFFRKKGKWLTVLVHLFASFSRGECRPYEVVVGQAAPSLRL